MASSTNYQREWLELESKFLRYRESGDPEVTEILFRELNAILSAYFSAKVRDRNEADELTQNTLLKVHMHRLAFNQDHSLRTWIFTIGSRTLTDHWRATGRRSNRIDGEAVIEQIGVASNDLGRLENRDQCEKLLAHLSPEDRELLRVYAVEDLAIKEIADNRGVSEGAMKVKLHRIYKNLRNLGGGSTLAIILCAFILEMMKPDSNSQRISRRMEPKEETV